MSKNIRYIEFNSDNNNQDIRITCDASLQEIESYIQTLTKEVEKSDSNFSTLKQTWIQLLSSLPLPIYKLENSFILRSRPNFNGEVFKSISDISYNPFADRVELNRFNLKGESVFYGALPITSKFVNGALTTMCESYKDIFLKQSSVFEQNLTIGKWKIHEPIKVALLTFYKVAVQKSEHVQNLIPTYLEFIRRCCNEEDQYKCLLFFNYFSECAGKRFDNDNNYLLTTAFYHALREFYKEDMGILYSSSMTDNYGLNIVLTKEIIDKKYLELELAVMYKWMRDLKDQNHFTILPFKIARVDIDKFCWSDITLSSLRTGIF